MPVDPAFAALLADKRSELRAPPAHVTADVMRAGNKAYLVTAPKTPIHAVEDRVLPGPAGPLNVRIYRPASDGRLPVIVFCHGGGFVLGDLDTHDSICHRLAHSSGCAVIAVDYRRAPETRFPGAIDDCSAALRWIVEHAASLDVDGERLALCGDSAGGNLAAATALRAQSRRPVRASRGPVVSDGGSRVRDGIDACLCARAPAGTRRRAVGVEPVPVRTCRRHEPAGVVAARGTRRVSADQRRHRRVRSTA